MATTTVEVYKINLRDGSLSAVSPLSHPRASVAAVAGDDYLYIFGGYEKEDVEISHCAKYDPVSDK